MNFSDLTWISQLSCYCPVHLWVWTRATQPELKTASVISSGNSKGSLDTNHATCLINEQCISIWWGDAAKKCLYYYRYSWKFSLKIVPFGGEFPLFSYMRWSVNLISFRAQSQGICSDPITLQPKLPRVYLHTPFF